MKNILIALSLLLIAGCHRAKSQQYDGAAMPGFTFYAYENDAPFTNDDIEEGKKSIVVLFDTNCSHCQAEIDSIGKHYNDFKQLNFYLVTLDAKPEIEKFMSTYGKGLNGKKNVTVLLDTAHEFIPKFQPTKYPALYVYSENKKLIKYFAGQNDIKEIIEAAK